jgi:hypothetical protein
MNSGFGLPGLDGIFQAQRRDDSLKRISDNLNKGLKDKDPASLQMMMAAMSQLPTQDLVSVLANLKPEVIKQLWEAATQPPPSPGGSAQGATGTPGTPGQSSGALQVNAKRQPLSAAEKADINWDKLNPKVRDAAEIAKGMGLTVTSGAEGHDGDGVHTSGSNHYSGSAIDVSGSPAKMAAFYNLFKGTKPVELFYDPLGGIKNGQSIGAIGGHSDHVHLAL